MIKEQGAAAGARRWLCWSTARVKHRTQNLPTHLPTMPSRSSPHSRQWQEVHFTWLRWHRIHGCCYCGERVAWKGKLIRRNERTGGPGQAHQARHPHEQKFLSAWDSGRQGPGIVFVYSVVCLIWARGYFRDLQSHPFDCFSLKHVCLVNYIW